MFRLLILSALLTFAPLASADSARPGTNQQLIDTALARWSGSPQAGWLSRILPPSIDAASLPQPESRGSELMARFCVQCHHLPSPAMHHPDKWPKIVDRMVVRMRGSGNRGALMKDMMGGVAAPDEEEVHMLIGYLRRNAQKPINPARYPDLATRGRSFRDACDQCHVLPEPSSRPAAEWRRVVKRMEDNMTWMNRVVGSRAVPGEPQLRPDDIVAYLERNAGR
jgi:cytochrome c2